jgi:hypothetical protein
LFKLSLRDTFRPSSFKDKTSRTYRIEKIIDKREIYHLI